jgi:galactokinase
LFHCGLKRQLLDAQTGYKERVTQCKKACELLDVPNLRALGIDDLPKIEALPSPYKERARHVITENQRVIEGVKSLQARDMTHFGELMTASHISQRDDYKVSIPAIDRLVDTALSHGALGARLTGGGFGGAMVALFEEGKGNAVVKAITEACPGSYLVQP